MCALLLPGRRGGEVVGRCRGTLTVLRNSAAPTVSTPCRGSQHGVEFMGSPRYPSAVPVPGSDAFHRGRRAARPSGDDRELAILATAERLLAEKPLSEI